MKKSGSLLIISFLAILCSCSDEPTYVDGNISQSSLNKNLYDKKTGNVPAYFIKNNDEQALDFIENKWKHLTDLLVLNPYKWIFRINIDSEKNIYTLNNILGYFDISANGAKVVITNIKWTPSQFPYTHLNKLDYCSDVKFKDGWKRDRKVGDPDNSDFYADFEKVNDEDIPLYGNVEIQNSYQGKHSLASWSFTIPPNDTPNFRAFEWDIVTDEPYFDYISCVDKNNVFTLKLLQLPAGNPAE